MLRVFSKYLVCGLLSLMVSVSFVTMASSSSDLYQVEIPVLDQSSKERRRALQESLETVLIRVSGQSPEFLRANVVVGLQLKKAEDYLLEYGYQAIEDKKEEPNIETEEEELLEKESAKGEITVLLDVAEPEEEKVKEEPQPTALLKASFSSVLIKSLLRKAGLSLWPSNRPSVLVWWQAEEPDSETDRVERALRDMESFQTEAAKRGLPVILPMKDRQDKKALSGLWGFDAETVEQVAERYGVSAMLVGRGVDSPMGWSGQWLFYFRGEQRVFPAVFKEGFPAPWHKTKTVENLEAVGVESAVQVLLQYYGIALSDNEQALTLVVSGVNQFKAYTEIFSYLQGLESVSQVNLLKTDNTTQRYRLSYMGSLPVLQELLGLNGLLIEEENSSEEKSLIEFMPTEQASESQMLEPRGLDKLQDLEVSEEQASEEQTSEEQTSEEKQLVEPSVEVIEPPNSVEKILFYRYNRLY